MIQTYVYDTKQEKVVAIEERTDISPDLCFENNKFGTLEMFTPRWYNNLGARKEYVASKSQLRKILKERNLCELG